MDLPVMASRPACHRIYRGKGAIEIGQRLVDHPGRRAWRVTTRNTVVQVKVTEQFHLGSFFPAHRRTRDRTV